MTEISENSSGSDISSKSWTLLDDSQLLEDELSDSFSEKPREIIEINSDVQNENQEIEEKHSNGFLSFDEYLEERLLEYDYEQQEKPEKLKKLYKEKLRNGFKKCKAQKWGISVFILIILGLSSFATLVSTLSQSPVEKRVPVRYSRPVKRENVPIYKDIIENMNTTLKDFDNLKTTKLLSVSTNTTNSQSCPKPSLKSLLTQTPPNLKPKDETFKLPEKPKKNLPKVSPQFEINETIDKILSGEILKEPIPKAKWVVIKDFFLDTNVHALVSLVITNFYLFTLLMDFNKQHKENSTSPCASIRKQAFLEDLDKCKNVEEIRKYLFKELPFWNAELTPKDKRKRKMKILENSSQSVNKTTSVVVFGPKNKPFNSISSQTYILSNLSTPIINSSYFEETGKSECQKRFEELDKYQKKYETLKQAQRNKIKLLKQKFKNEVNFIRDTEEESDVKAERINKTSQMFIRKLKFNREKYLLELKKMREAKRKVGESKKKDIAVGSYEVSLPSIYNYGEKFKMIKEKFEKEKPQIPKEFKFQ